MARGGLGGGAAPPPAAHQILIKQVLAAKMRLRSADTFNRLIARLFDCFVASLVGSCSSSVLWVVAIAVVVVVVAVGSRCCCCGSELELELVHPPL